MSEQNPTPEELEEFRKEKFLRHAREEFLHWAKNRFWVVLAIIAGVAWIGLPLIVNQLIADRLESKVDDATKALLTAQNLIEKSKLASQKATDASIAASNAVTKTEAAAIKANAAASQAIEKGNKAAVEVDNLREEVRSQIQTINDTAELTSDKLAKIQNLSNDVGKKLASIQEDFEEIIEESSKEQRALRTLIEKQILKQFPPKHLVEVRVNDLLAGSEIKSQILDILHNYGTVASSLKGGQQTNKAKGILLSYVPNSEHIALEVGNLLKEIFDLPLVFSVTTKFPHENFVEIKLLPNPPPSKP